MVAGFALTKEPESPGEQQASVGLIGTMLSCKARRIQRRRVNDKAGASGQPFNARVASERNKVGIHTKLCHAPHGATVWGGL